MDTKTRVPDSMTFWCGSGSGDSLQDANKKIIFLTKFFCLLLFEGTFTSVFKDKKSKRSHKTVRIKVFLTILLDNKGMIEGSVSTPLTNGSGSGRPKNMWIRWIHM
jgi:hypothetical protein